MNNADGPGRARRGGARAARAEARPAVVPYVTRRVPVYDVMSAEGLELIEHNAETILEEIGVEFRGDPEALALWRDAGADVDVDGERVRIPRGLARRIVTDSAPAEFVQHARNPERSARIGGPHMVFAPAYGPPFIRSLDEGRRYATIEDFRNFVKLAYLSPGLHHSEARCASRSTCRSTSATSTWSTATCATRTSRSWVQSPPRSAPRTPWRWQRSSSATRSWMRTRSSPA